MILEKDILVSSIIYKLVINNMEVLMPNKRNSDVNIISLLYRGRHGLFPAFISSHFHLPRLPTRTLKKKIMTDAKVRIKQVYS